MTGRQWPMCKPASNAASYGPSTATASLTLPAWWRAITNPAWPAPSPSCRASSDLPAPRKKTPCATPAQHHAGPAAANGFPPPCPRWARAAPSRPAPPRPGRRQWLAAALPLRGAGGLVASGAGMARAASAMDVWKAPDCGCCQHWVQHMQANGFELAVHDSGNNAVRPRLGLPQKWGSCHTALIDGYLVEGHVPASDVRTLLRQRPKALGLAVPGMPIGSPGMDGPEYGRRHTPYDVLLIAHDGSARVFNSYPAPGQHHRQP